MAIWRVRTRRRRAARPRVGGGRPDRAAGAATPRSTRCSPAARALRGASAPPTGRCRPARPCSRPVQRPGGVGGRRDLRDQPQRAQRGVRRARLLRPRVRRRAPRAVLQGRARAACAGRAGRSACARTPAGTCPSPSSRWSSTPHGEIVGLHDRQRRLVALDRGREPAVPAAGEDLPRLRARSVRASCRSPRRPTRRRWRSASTIARDGEHGVRGLDAGRAAASASPAELVDWLFRAQDFAVGVVLLTGTSIVPAQGVHAARRRRGADRDHRPGRAGQHGGGGRRMKAIVWQGPERMAVEERPDPPDPGAGELIVRPQAVGICGSEIEGYLGHMGNRTPPLVMGHEFAGVVVAAGDGRRRVRGRARRGQPARAAAARCRLCRSGHANLCPRPQADRRPLRRRVRRPRARAGRERARAARRRVGAHRRARRAARQRRARGAARARARSEVERAVVLGAGHDRPRHAAGGAAGGHRARRACSSRRRSGARARRRSARTRPTVDGEALDAERAATDGLGADLVLDAVGAQATRRLALELLRPGGQAVYVGLAADDTTLGFHDVVRGQLDAPGLLRLHDGRLRAGATSGWSSGRASLGELRRRAAARRRARTRSRGSPTGRRPPQVKVFLAGAGREA